MNIYGAEVEVVLGDMGEQDTETFLYDSGEFSLPSSLKQEKREIGSVFILPREGMNARHKMYAVTGDESHSPDEVSIRKAVCNSLITAQKHHILSLSISALGINRGFSVSASAKITAQEIFRYLKESEEPCLKLIRCVLVSREVFDVFLKNVLGYLGHMVDKMAQGPYVTVDGIVEVSGGLIMVERSNPPFGWALPGGFVEYGESVEEAVKREIKEETNLEFIDVKQFKVYSSPDRDPRFHTVSVVFCGKGEGSPLADSDAADVNIFEYNELPAKIAFDHRKIIEDYIKDREFPLESEKVVTKD